MSIAQNRKVIAVVLFLSVCLLSGCVIDYEQDDIAEYVHDTYDLEDFKVSKEAVIWEDWEGYDDYIWTIRMNDEPQLVFHVKDDYGWGMESVTNHLWSDYEEVALEYLYDNYDETMNRLDFVTEAKDGMVWSGFEGSYENRAQLRELYQEMQAFYSYVEESEYEISVYAVFKMQHVLRNQCEYEIDDGDYIRRYEESLTEEDLWEAEKEYLLTCLDYRLEDQLAEFTQEEIELALEDYNYGIFIEREDGMAEKYMDLCASKYGYGISFATLYEILLREGFEVSGDHWHYSFVGIDGCQYEISYDFCDYMHEDSDGEEHLGYYYLKDGQQMPMDYFFYNHFDEMEIAEMTGLTLHISR